MSQLKKIRTSTTTFTPILEPQQPSTEDPFTEEPTHHLAQSTDLGVQFLDLGALLHTEHGLITKKRANSDSLVHMFKLLISTSAFICLVKPKGLSIYCSTENG